MDKIDRHIRERSRSPRQLWRCSGCGMTIGAEHLPSVEVRDVSLPDDLASVIKLEHVRCPKRGSAMVLYNRG